MNGPTFSKPDDFDTEVPWPEAKRLEEVLNTHSWKDPVWHDAEYEVFRDGAGAPYVRVRLTLGRHSYMHLYLKDGGTSLTLESPVCTRLPRWAGLYVLRELTELYAPFLFRIDTAGHSDVLVLWAEYRFPVFACHGVETLADFIGKVKKARAELKGQLTGTAPGPRTGHVYKPTLPL